MRSCSIHKSAMKIVLAAAALVLFAAVQSAMAQVAQTTATPKSSTTTTPPAPPTPAPSKPTPAPAPALSTAPIATPPAASAKPAAAAPAAAYDPTKQDATLPKVGRSDNMRTLLYEVRDPKAAKDTPSVYLFGTLHVGKSSFYPLPDLVDQAYRASKVLVLEANPSDQKDADAITKMIQYPAGETIEKHISPQLNMRLRAQLQRLRIPAREVLNMRPVMLGGLFPVVEYTRLGYDMRLGLDAHLLERAKKDTKPVKELESPLAQIALLTNMPADLQEAFLDNAIAQLETNRTADMLHTMVAAWMAGDPEAMQRVFDDNARGMKRVNDLNQVLLVKRNETMAGKIVDYLKTGEGHFVAVGSLHLTGTKGLVDMLRARGLDVRQL
jgi:uncharacterized protein